MHKRDRMGRNIAKSLSFAFCEYEHRTGSYPKKVFAELDAYYALQLCLPMHIFDNELKFNGITVERIEKPGIGIYLCGDPVLIRDFHDPGVQIVLP